MMRYQTLGEVQLTELAKSFLEKSDLDTGDTNLVDSHHEHGGSGETVDLRPLRDRAKEMRTLHASLLDDPEFAGDLDRIEGRLSPILHQGLADCRVPDEAMESPDFWRYLALRYFWWFIFWRHQTAQSGKNQAFKEGGKYLRYLDHKKHEISVLARMYIRADLSLDESGSYELAWAGKGATDLWQSHVIPVRTGFSPVLVRALLRRQAREPLGTEDLRDVVKQIKRSNTNVMPIDWDDAEADAYIGHHWPG